MSEKMGSDDDPDLSLLYDTEIHNKATTYLNWHKETATLLKTGPEKGFAGDNDRHDISKVYKEVQPRYDEVSQRRLIFSPDLPKHKIQAMGTVIRLTITKNKHRAPPPGFDDADLESELAGDGEGVTNRSWCSDDDSTPDSETSFASSSSELDSCERYLHCTFKRVSQSIQDGQTLPKFAGPPRYIDSKGVLQYNLRKEGKLPTLPKGKHSTRKALTRRSGKGSGACGPDPNQYYQQSPPPRMKIDKK